MTKQAFDEAFPPKPIGVPAVEATWVKPIESEAMACTVRQIPAMMERNAKHGLRVDYNPQTGAPILTSRAERRRLMRIEGLIDRQGGYGD